MKKISAGILLFRGTDQVREFFLVHFGGPFWKNRQAGAWSIPKGEGEEGEPLLGTAVREFKEETGTAATGDLIPLSPVTQKSGKVVYAWALDMDIDPENIRSNMVTTKVAGKKIQFPEIDKGGWFTRAAAKELIIPAQFRLITELEEILRN